MKNVKKKSWGRWPAAGLLLASGLAMAQEKQLGEVVVSASRSEQTRFDAPASIDAVHVDPTQDAKPLINLSELVQTVPGILVRDRQNYAQDLQLSVRGFGTRSTFGVRGVRILIDGIPATMPDGQGQVSSASLMSASRVEVLRGPLAQLYGNAAGGVVQIFTRDPATGPRYTSSLEGGSYGQRQASVVLAAGNRELGGLLDLTHFHTDGYRDHSAAERDQANAKLVARPSNATTVTATLNWFHTPLAQDPMGLTRAQWQANPRQAVPEAYSFDTRKIIEQQQAGVQVEHKLSSTDKLQARVYAGTRSVFQTLALSGAALSSSGGVVDLNRSYGGVGLSWSRDTLLAQLPFKVTAGLEADRQREQRKGYVNNGGVPGALRRDEDDNASNVDVYAQADWTVHPQWRLIAGARASRVRFGIDDFFVAPGNPNDSGSLNFHHVSPVLGTVWYATDNLNIYANLGEGFETPTLAEAAYRVGGSGPNFGLRASNSRQGELGLKYRRGRHAFEAAAFVSNSSNEIVPSAAVSGRTIFQNVDGVQRRGVEASWQAQWDSALGRLNSRLGYTLVDAQFQQSFLNTSSGAVVAAGNRLPGVPLQAVGAELALRHHERVQTALEMRVESRTFVNDVNSDAAPGFVTFNLRSSVDLKAGRTKMMLFGRIDNLFDRRYIGSVIVNESNGRYFEPAIGRSLFVGLRAWL